MVKPVIVVHGGAWGIPDDQVDDNIAGVEEASIPKGHPKIETTVTPKTIKRLPITIDRVNGSSLSKTLVKSTLNKG